MTVTCTTPGWMSHLMNLMKLIAFAGSRMKSLKKLTFCLIGRMTDEDYKNRFIDCIVPGTGVPDDRADHCTRLY